MTDTEQKFEENNRSVTREEIVMTEIHEDMRGLTRHGLTPQDNSSAIAAAVPKFARDAGENL